MKLKLIPFIYITPYNVYEKNELPYDMGDYVRFSKKACEFIGLTTNAFGIGPHLVQDIHPIGPPFGNHLIARIQGLDISCGWLTVYTKGKKL